MGLGLPTDDNHIVTHWCGGFVALHEDGQPDACMGCRKAFDHDYHPSPEEFTVWVKEKMIP